MSFLTVGVITTEYSKITDPAELKQYILDRVSQGSGSTMFGGTNIPAAEYADGTTAAGAIGTAITNRSANPSIPNKRAVIDKMALGVEYLDGLATLAIPIANLPANATTREEAATNITVIGFTPEKLTASSHGIPATATFTAIYVGNGIIELEITNGADFEPAAINVVAVALPPVTIPATPPPVVTLSNGQIQVTSKVSVPIITKTVTGKGRGLKLSSMDSNPSWLIYIYSMNGNKLISLISVGVTVNLYTPPTV
jgi:hypothetical protein